MRPQDAAALRAVAESGTLRALGDARVRADPVRSEDLDDRCNSCALVSRFQTIYTRRRDA